MVNVGSFVKSKYKASWKGLVVSEEILKGSGKKANKMCTVLVLLDRCGKPLRKRLIHTLNSYWLEDIEKFSLTRRQINHVSNHKLQFDLYKELEEDV